MQVGYWWLVSPLFCFIVACLVVWVYPKGAGSDPLDFFADGARARPSEAQTDPAPEGRPSQALPQLGTVQRRLGETVDEGQPR